MLSPLKKKLKALTNTNEIAAETVKHAQALFISGQCQLLSQSKEQFDFWVSDEFTDAEISISIKEKTSETDQESSKKAKYDFSASKNGKAIDWDKYAIACLMQLSEELSKFESERLSEGKKYTRDGMIKRVMKERQEKANAADYRIEFADNIYGEHILTNERGVKYRITLRDFENETGYVDNMDLRTNKLGTTKHIMYAFQAIKSDKKRYRKLKKTYPFVEIYLDPLNDYQISWFYPHELDYEIKALIDDYFGDKRFIPHNNTTRFLSFLNRAHIHKEILIRPEVRQKVEKAFEDELLESLKERHTIDFSLVDATLFEYQKEGIEFLTFKKGAILADEMGLGKTMQAIGTALQKKQIFAFRRTLIICPASLKHQWKSEIEKFSAEKATVIEGNPQQRIATYRDCQDYFLIANYETILRDQHELNKFPADLIILDEAQRIKNYHTRTSNAIKSLKRKHALVLTGTPIENKLIDLYSIVAFIDPYFLAPLWEFSYQHCYFDH
ncbi:MAG: DEAD/DEAH box helicase, partial [Flammeovirgaceae bacterium]